MAGNFLGNVQQALGGISQGLMSPEQEQTQMKQEILRKQTFFGDAIKAVPLLEQGNFGGIADFYQHRADTLGRFKGASSKDSIDIANLARAAQNGDPAAIEQLTARLGQAASVGSAMGLGAPKGAGFTLGEGQSRYDAAGNVIATGKKKESDEGVGKFTDFRSVNKDVGGLVQDAKKIRGAATRLSRLAKTKSPTDQLAAVFTFMKALDPTSVVREGEQQQARSTGGPADQFIGYVNKLQGGGSLPPAVFDQMVATAQRLSDQSAQNARGDVTGYLDAYGGRIRVSDMKNLLGRIPERFNPTEDDSAGEDLGGYSVEQLQQMLLKAN